MHDRLDPGGPLLFVEFAGCCAEDHCSLLDLRALKDEVIQIEEHDERREGNTLISVVERMTFDDGPGDGGAKFPDRLGTGVVDEIGWTRECGFERTFISNAGETAVGLNDASLDVAQDIAANVLNLHFASSR